MVLTEIPLVLARAWMSGAAPILSLNLFGPASAPLVLKGESD